MNSASFTWLMAGSALLLALFWLFRSPSHEVRPASDGPEKAALQEAPTSSDMPTAPDKPEGFGYKMAWLAVHTTNTAALLQALPMLQPQRCTWQQGVAGAYGPTVFVTPAVGKWTLIAGTSLPFLDSPAAVKEAEALLLQLSRTFGEAQYFSSHRVVEAHGGMKAVDGQLVRAYAYVGDQGETVVATGASTPAEPATLINTLSAAAQQDSTYLERPDLTSPDEELVMHIAAQWSVDPTALDERRDIAHGMGWQGHYKRK
jgi:hypothetical protein